MLTLRQPLTWLALTLSLAMLLCLRYQHDLQPLGCDPFGYAYQAQLFRSHGLGGFSTAIDAPQARLLVQLASHAFPEQSSWFRPIAPHCYHYDAHSAQIILQYPPGTGMVLALFPAAYAMPCLEILGALLVAGVVLGVGRRRSLQVGATAALMFASAVLLWMLARNLAYWSASIPLTAVLIPLFAALARNLTDRARGTALLFGLIAGLLVAIRLPSVLLWLAPLVQETWRARLWQWARLKPKMPQLLCTLAGLLLGLLPLFVANALNTGSPFRTTYAAHDAALPQLDPRQVLASLHYYFSAPLGAPLLYAAVLLIVLAYVEWRRHRQATLLAALLGAVAMLGASLLFFATHAERTHYYLIPSALLAMFSIAFAWSGESVAAPRSRSWLWLLPPCLIAALALHHLKPYRLQLALPPALQDSQHVVWADMSSGTLYQYAQRYAGALKTTVVPMRDALVDLVRSSGHVQYFVVDSADMRSICDRQAARYGVRYVGTAQLFLPTAVWQLSDDGSGQRRCAPPERLPLGRFDQNGRSEQN